MCKTKSGHITRCANYIKHLSDSGVKTLHHRDLLAVDDVPASYYLPIEPVIITAGVGRPAQVCHFMKANIEKQPMNYAKPLSSPPSISADYGVVTLGREVGEEFPAFTDLAA